MSSSETMLRYAVMIPNNIDLDELLVQYPLLNHVPNARDYLLYILKRIKSPNVIAESNNETIQSYTLINSVGLQKIVQHYASLLNWLIERGILESDNYYQVDAKPKGYRFTTSYCTALKQDFIRKKSLVKKLAEIDYQISIKKLDANKENNLHGNQYGYEPIWLRYKDVAKLLNLMPRIMKVNLIKHGLVSDDIKSHLESNHTKFFYYEEVWNKQGFYGAVLMINGDYINRVEEIALRFPQDFRKRR